MASRLFCVCALLLVTCAVLAQQTLDPTTGRCTWRDPGTSGTLVCPPAYPHCSRYEGICYEVVAGAVEACRFDYTGYYHIPRRCVDFQPTEPPVVTPDPPQPPAPQVDARLQCWGGFRLTVLDEHGQVLRSENTESVFLGVEEQQPVRYHLACDHLEASVDGLYTFSLAYRQSATLVLDGETLVEEQGGVAGEDQRAGAERLLVKGGHSLELLSDQGPGRTTLVLGWTMVEERQCPGLEREAPVPFLPWDGGVVAHRIRAMRLDNSELGTILGEETVQGMELRQIASGEQGLAHEYEGTVTVVEADRYLFEVAGSGYVEVEVDGRPAYGLHLLARREVQVQQEGIRLEPGQHRIKVVFKPKSECLLVDVAVVGLAPEGGSCGALPGSPAVMFALFLGSMLSLASFRRRSSRRSHAV